MLQNCRKEVTLARTPRDPLLLTLTYAFNGSL